MPILKVYVTHDETGRVLKKVPQSRIGGFRVWQEVTQPNETYHEYVTRMKGHSDCRVIEVPYTGQQVGDE